MTSTATAAVIILIILLLADSLVILYILIYKIWLRLIHNRRENIHAILTDTVTSQNPFRIASLFKSKIDRQILIDSFIELSQSMNLAPETINAITDIYRKTDCYRSAVRRLSSPSRYRRISGSIELCFFAHDISREAIESRFSREKSWLVKFYFAYALSVIKDPLSIQVLIDSLIHAPLWYQKKVSVLLCKFDKAIEDIIDSLYNRREDAICNLLFTMANDFSSTRIAAFLLFHLDGDDPEKASSAAASMKARYYHLLFTDKYLNHSAPQIRRHAIEASVNIANGSSVARLLPMLSDEENQRIVINAITNIITIQPGLTALLIHAYFNESYQENQKAILSILSNRLEYLVLKLQGHDRNQIQYIITEIISSNFLSPLIGFLNRNHNIDLENELLELIKRALPRSASIRSELELYLLPRVLDKLGLEKAAQPVFTKTVTRHPKRTFILSLTLFFLFLSGPAVFAIVHWGNYKDGDWLTIFKQFIFDYNFVLIYYSFAVNAIYLFLLFLSAATSIRQSRYSRIKMNSLLFEKNIMPSISIIAPAFNEEATIIESVNSLLNLWYPEYELIVVNDGSNDQTVQKLIDYFSLEKVDIVYNEDIKTRPVLAIYKNRLISKLLVVNKINGGKADSLNAGINIASGEYVCGIDADSLLEKDALIKIASSSLDIEVETVAAGGNILPINGCSIRRGAIDKFAIPHNHLAVFQMIEYFRSFMAGRIGWASLNCLLIISGAFGLFSRKRIIEIGGYLTSSGYYKQDTVGEDMELVVRLSRHMREIKVPFSINYSYNANCWTEVPENISTFIRQRDRWHRGLIEIISFHSKLLFNPKYGRLGSVAIPYFVLFEMLGPWIELTGYIMVIAALTMGLLNTPVVLLLFAATIMTGTFISTASLIIAGQEMRHFTIKEVVRLISYSVIENFGFRQIISFLRCRSYINVLLSVAGWGIMVRKGFGTAQTSQTADIIDRK